MAGRLYKFDLVLRHQADSDSPCSRAGSKGDFVVEKCHLEVFDVPYREISLLVYQGDTARPVSHWSRSIKTVL